jgi:F-type H+-transporting ATPase subunit b
VEQLAQLGINPGFLLIQIVNLIIAYVVIAKWIVGPIMGLLEKRRQTIAQGLEDARVAADARSNAEKEAAKVLADAQAEAGKVVREATDRAITAAKEVKVAAEAEAVKAREAPSRPHKNWSVNHSMKNASTPCSANSSPV